MECDTTLKTTSKKAKNVHIAENAERRMNRERTLFFWTTDDNIGIFKKEAQYDAFLWIDSPVIPFGLGRFVADDGTLSKCRQLPLW